jgi:hypothetical protein
MVFYQVVDFYYAQAIGWGMRDLKQKLNEDIFSTEAIISL